MRWAVLTVLVVALVVLVFYAARSNAETPPAPTPTPAPTYAVSPSVLMARAPTVTFERTAEETWRADVIRTAQDYERAMTTYVERFPTFAAGRNALLGARAIAAAAPMESRASLMFRIAFASGPPSGAGAGRRTWDALVAAIRAPIEFRPAAAVKPIVVTGIVPLGDFSV